MFCFKNKKEISEDVGAAAGTTVRHAGLKVAAVILAGVVGGSGVTYGVVKMQTRFRCSRTLRKRMMFR